MLLPSLSKHYPASLVLYSNPTPCPLFDFLALLSLVGHTPREEPTGSPGLPYYINIQRAKVSDPGEAKMVSP